MNRTVIIAVLTGMVFSGFEAAAEDVDPALADPHEHAHEIHGSAHSAGHDHDETTDHDDHFCHCGVHAPALPSSDVTPIVSAAPVAATRHDDWFSSMHPPPLLRPPNS